MAGAGYKLFNTGDVLTAAQVNTYLQEQVVMVFADATARTTALSGVLAEGMVSYLKDTNATEVYDGSAWVGIGNSGDITGVTAGTGISGGGTSGTVTITNSMATEITAAGDIIVGTGSGTFDNLPIGTTGQVLTADTTVSPYKVKWASAASGGFTFQSWTPTWTNLSVGNGTLTARYGTSGKFTHFELYLTLGSTTSVSGVIKFSLPTTPKNSSTYQGQYTNVMMHDNGAQIYFGQGYIDKTNALLEVYGNYVTGTYLERVGTSATVPFTWTNGDELIVTGNYEEA